MILYFRASVFYIEKYRVCELISVASGSVQYISPEGLIDSNGKKLRLHQDYDVLHSTINNRWTFKKVKKIKLSKKDAKKILAEIKKVLG